MHLFSLSIPFGGLVIDSVTSRGAKLAFSIFNVFFELLLGSSASTVSFAADIFGVWLRKIAYCLELPFADHLNALRTLLQRK